MLPLIPFVVTGCTLLKFEGHVAFVGEEENYIWYVTEF